MGEAFMPNTKTDNTKIGESRAYWTHKVDRFPSPVAQLRMSQLIDLDDRLYETAKIVYRFLVGWYHDEHGDALMSQRHVAKVMKQRAPEGAAVPSRNAVQRAIIALMETGWVVRTFQGRGKGKGASRYVPVINVLELAAQGKFPEPARTIGPVEPAHHNGPLVAHATGPVDAEPAHATGPKTLLPDPSTDGATGRENDCAAPLAPLSAGLSAADADPAQDAKLDPFAELWRAYGYKRSKTEARRAYTNLAPDADLHAAMVESATAWRETWAAQNKPDAPRYTLAKWIEREEYECSPPTAYRPKERKAKQAAANSNQPQAGSFGPPLRILKVKETGSPFEQRYAVTIRVDGESGVQEHEIVVIENGETNLAGSAVYNKIAVLGGFEDWPGARIRLSVKDGVVVGAMHDNAPDRAVEITEAEVVKRGGTSAIMARLTDASGAPEGKLRIVIESNDTHEQEDGQRQLNDLCNALSIPAPEDVEELLFRPFRMTGSKFLPAVAVEAA
jgi:hypothetical protein